MTENRLGIKAIGTYLPQGRLDSAELAKEQGFDLDFLIKKVGIQQRCVSAVDESVSDMAVAACRDLAARDPRLKLQDIESVVVCTQTPDYQIPHTSALVQDRLGLPTSAAAFDIGLACSGFVYSLSVALSFMTAHGMTNGLLITSETYTKLIRQNDRNTVALFGDGATAVWLGLDPLAEPGEFSFGTNGSGWQALTVREGGSRHPGRLGHLEMDGRAIFDFVMKIVPGDMDRCLNANGLSREDVDYFVFHQASGYLLDVLVKRLRLPREKVFLNLWHVGNTVSSSIPLAISDLLTEKPLAGKKLFISGFGAGLSWASTVLKFA